MHKPQCISMWATPQGGKVCTTLCYVIANKATYRLDSVLNLCYALLTHKKQGRQEQVKMTQVSNDLGFAECICGRMAAKGHCPYCGSYDVYAQGRKHDEFVNEPETGERRRIASFRCRRCAMHFNEWQWRRYCTAPPYVWQARKMQQKQAEQIRDKEVARLTQKQKTLLTEPSVLAYINRQRAKEGLLSLDKEGNEVQGQVVVNEYEAVKDPDGLGWRILNKTTNEFTKEIYQTESGALRDMEDMQ